MPNYKFNEHSLLLFYFIPLTLCTCFLYYFCINAPLLMDCIYTCAQGDRTYAVLFPALSNLDLRFAESYLKALLLTYNHVDPYHF